MSAPEETRWRAYVETYGCQMNIADGELMEGVLTSGGYEIVSAPEGADVILVNTCAIREHAERRVLGRVSQFKPLKAERPGTIIGVTGCMAQRMGASLLARAPYVDLVMGPDGYRSLPEQLERIRVARGSSTVASASGTSAVADVGAPDFSLGPTGVDRKGRGRLQLAVLELDASESYEGLEQLRSDGPSAWIPIQRGCDHRCTFCIVPYVRGPEKNRAPQDVLDEVARLADRGVSDVTLLGQTVNSYRSGEWTFPRLLRAVARTAGVRRVRFTSPHPSDVSEALIEVMATEDALCEYLHLPAQSGSDRTLKRMVRRYTVRDYLGIVERVRAAIPDVALSTDIIVGFPGETEGEFEETLDLMREVRFDDAYTYKFSRRDGTPATRLPEEDAIPDTEAQRRLETLIQVTRGIRTEINEREVGRVEELLLERGAREPGELLGRTRRNKIVALPGEGREIGEYVWAQLVGTTGATFSARLLESGSAQALAHARPTADAMADAVTAR